MGDKAMELVLAAIDASAYTESVCRLAAWASARLRLPVELLHVVQRSDPVTARRDLSGSIGLGVKSELMEELVRLSEEDARAEVEKGRALLQSAGDLVREAGADDVTLLHRHGGIVETILEREADARIVVIGKRGASHEFASDHIGSKIERVVRASGKPVLVAARAFREPQHVVFAYDASPAAERTLERLTNSPLFAGLPVTMVMAETASDSERRKLENAAASIADGRPVATRLERGKAEQIIPEIVAGIEGALLMMGAYGHSPIRTMIVGSTTTAMIRTVKAPVLLVR
jgi:nucleotide-binding universal stress UspA family protein